MLPLFELGGLSGGSWQGGLDAQAVEAEGMPNFGLVIPALALATSFSPRHSFRATLRMNTSYLTALRGPRHPRPGVQSQLVRSIYETFLVLRFSQTGKAGCLTNRLYQYLVHNSMM